MVLRLELGIVDEVTMADIGVYVCLNTDTADEVQLTLASGM